MARADVDAFLDRLDATVNVCGTCGRELAVDGPSLYYCNERCATGVTDEWAEARRRIREFAANLSTEDGISVMLMDPQTEHDRRMEHVTDVRMVCATDGTYQIRVPITRHVIETRVRWRDDIRDLFRRYRAAAYDRIANTEEART